jgi:hypothetical protein
MSRSGLLDQLLSWFSGYDEILPEFLRGNEMSFGYENECMHIMDDVNANA